MLKEITIQGTTYPCHLTMGAMLRFKRESGKDVSQLEGGDVADLLLFVYCCTRSACNATGQPFDLNFETFCDLLTPEDFTAFNLAMAKNNASATDEKKTAPLPTSTNS